MKKFTKRCCLLFIILLLLAQTVFAFNPVNIISNDEGNVVTSFVSDAFSIVSGNNASVIHNIFGTAIVTGNIVNIESEIDGDLIIFGGDITIGGKVSGNVYAFGETLTITGEPQKDVFVFGNSILIDKGSVLNRDAFLFAKSAKVYGDIKRDANIFAGNFSLTGRIERNLYANSNDIRISKNSVVAGNFNYESTNDAFIETGATINGATQKQVPSPTVVKAKTFIDYALDIMFTLGVALVFWAFLLLIAPKLTGKFALLLENNPGKSAGFGAIALFTVLIVSIILMFTVIGIPLGIILLSVYAIMMYLAFYMSAGAFGIIIFKYIFKLGDLHKNLWYVLAGVLITKLLSMVPIIGWIFSLAATIFGFGLLVLLIINNREKQI